MRFKNFYGDWLKNELKNICNIRGGYSFSLDFQGQANGEIPFYKVSDMNNIGNETFMSKSNNYLTMNQLKTIKAKPFSKNTVIFAKVGAALLLDRKRITTRECLIDSNMMGMTLLSQNDYDIYFLYLQLLRQKLAILSRVGALPSINASDVGKISISFPSIVEQNKISAFLKILDERIDAQNKIIEEYQTLKNCIFDAIILKSRKIGTCKINKIIEEYNVKTTKDNEHPVLSSTATGIYFQNEYFNKEAASENTTGYKCVPKGYCTYRSMSDTGRFYFNIQSITDVGIVSPAYPVFSVKEDSALFLVSVLNSDKTIINEILKLKAGGTRFSLPFKKLVELEVPWPNHQTRKHFMKMIRNIIYKIDLEQKILAKYIDQKTYLLNNMFI